MNEREASGWRATGWLVAVLVGLGCSAGAQAQAPRRDLIEAGETWSITQAVGYGGGGQFEDQSSATSRRLQEARSLGLFVNRAVDDWRHYELFYISQSTRLGGATPLDIDIHYLQFGGSVSYQALDNLVPYLGMTVGAARFSPSGGRDSETRLAFSVGTGLRLPLSEQFGLRLDLRALVSTFDTDGNIFCVAAAGVGTCGIRARSSTLVQYSASLGVILRF